MVVPVYVDEARACARTPDGITGAHLYRAMVRTAQAGAQPACASAFARAEQVQQKNRPNPPALGAIPDCPIAARCNAVISQA